jgi:hypothetical protein
MTILSFWTAKALGLKATNLNGNPTEESRLSGFSSLRFVRLFAKFIRHLSGSSSVSCRTNHRRMAVVTPDQGDVLIGGSFFVHLKWNWSYIW